MTHCGDDQIMADPTLDDCCAREHAAHVRVEALKARLQAVDRSMARITLASDVVASVPERLADEEDSDDEAGMLACPAQTHLFT